MDKMWVHHFTLETKEKSNFRESCPTKVKRVQSGTVVDG